VSDFRSSAAVLVSTRTEYGHLFSIYVPIAAGVFVVVVLVMIGAILRYRRARTPARRNNATALEGSYAVLLACVVAFLLWETFSAEHQVDTVAKRERPSLTINVTAARWEWNFAYAGDGVTARSGRTGHQPLVVPANRAIRFNLASLDVIHAIWIPELEFKRDLIPGHTGHVTLTFTRTGTFGGQCAVFCGEYHSEMVFTVRVLPPAGFADWLAAHRATGRAAATTTGSA
jgi:cytochrome c oxidase subunit II